MKIGLICPYAMNVPGGVQGQVVGLADAYRALGHEVWIIAPCDGEPPRNDILVAGHSVPNFANGAVAPIAPDLSAQRKTIKLLRTYKFDVQHLHEPFL